ncbi:MAG TPA: hypothetical protein VGV39_19650 [Mesorhizobium sp.]|uniref:hypothetical protein n=1 Tax=Mesorhizobium sp. TaxID=1871066 RepID=UPI002DDD1345|nr:hypothetical protein [Mesorhizobium sp.]HEV2505301.1 hypothetical protein [Mesorhizobium sp.]
MTRKGASRLISKAGQTLAVAHRPTMPGAEGDNERWRSMKSSASSTSEGAQRLESVGDPCRNGDEGEPARRPAGS